MRNIFLINDQKEQFKTKETLNSRKIFDTFLSDGEIKTVVVHYSHYYYRLKRKRPA